MIGFNDTYNHLDKRILSCKELGKGMFIGSDNVGPPVSYRLKNVSLKI